MKRLLMLFVKKIDLTRIYHTPQFSIKERLLRKDIVFPILSDNFLRKLITNLASLLLQIEVKFSLNLCFLDLSSYQIPKNLMSLAVIFISGGINEQFLLRQF